MKWSNGKSLGTSDAVEEEWKVDISAEDICLKVWCSSTTEFFPLIFLKISLKRKTKVDFDYKHKSPLITNTISISPRISSNACSGFVTGLFLCFFYWFFFFFIFLLFPVIFMNDSWCSLYRNLYKMKLPVMSNSWRSLSEN